MDGVRRLTAFAGDRMIGSGDLRTMLTATKTWLDEDPNQRVLIFEDDTGKQVDFDFRGSLADVLDRAEAVPSRSGPGRPKLGVISREVSLLPRHWDWLEQHPSGISAALRRLIDEARKREPDQERERRRRDAVSRFLWAIAGNLPDFEEATRSLFNGESDRFHHLIETWPSDIRDHATRLLAEPDGADQRPNRSGRESF